MLAARWQVLFSTSIIKAWVQKAFRGQSLLGMKESVNIQRVGRSLRTITIPDRILLMRPRFLTTQTPQFSDLAKAVKPTTPTSVIHRTQNCPSSRDLSLLLPSSHPRMGPVVSFWKHLRLLSFRLLHYLSLSKRERKKAELNPSPACKVGTK